MLSTTVGSKLQTGASIRAMRAARSAGGGGGGGGDGLTRHLQPRDVPCASSRAHVRRSGIAEERLSVIVLDVDHFKTINDTVGHHVGNRVLMAVADRLRECSRITDLLARCGGDEFALILPDTDAVGARLVADRIDASIREISDELDLSIPSNRERGSGHLPRRRLQRHGAVPHGGRPHVRGQAPSPPGLTRFPRVPAWLRSGRPRPRSGAPGRCPR